MNNILLVGNIAILVLYGLLFVLYLDLQHIERIQTTERQRLTVVSRQLEQERAHRRNLELEIVRLRNELLGLRQDLSIALDPDYLSKEYE